MIIVDGWQVPLCRAAAATWPGPSWPYWHQYQDSNSLKRTSKDPLRLPAACHLLVSQMACLTSPHVSAFPDLDLYGAGMHWMSPGGFLSKHRDGGCHPLTGWGRRWNAILFVGECKGGELLLDGFKPVEPVVGRLVQFDSRIPHEVAPVVSGERMSLSLFWWSLECDDPSVGAQFYKQAAVDQKSQPI